MTLILILALLFLLLLGIMIIRLTYKERIKD